jgi:hypothetical protein
MSRNGKYKISWQLFSSPHINATEGLIVFFTKYRQKYPTHSATHTDILGLVK